MDIAYHHEKLQTSRSLRILNLQPSINSSEPLRCSISQTTLDVNPSFEALSYVWGTPEPKRHITVQIDSQGHSRERILVITPNCAAALKRLRHRFRARALWVDAICIDQTSIDDKNQQVPLMGQIYASASQVLVWLGEPEEGGDYMKSAFNIVKKAGSLYQLGLIRPHVDPAVEPPEIPLPHIRVSENHIASEVRKHKDQILKIYANPFWQRVWTVQEIALARKIAIISGSVEVNYPDFCVLAVFIDSNMSFFTETDWEGRDVRVQRLVDHYLESHFIILDADDLATLHRKGGGIAQEMEFPEQNVLLGAKSLNASEPRDKVYAMLWAFTDAKEKDSHSSLFKVNYNKPVEDLFTEFTAFLLIHLEWEWKYWPLLLASEGRDGEKSSKLPSWVPDWELNEDYHDLYAFGTRVTGIGIDDREDDDKILKFYIEGRHLHVWGMRHASVIAAFKFPHPMNTIDELDDDSEDLKPEAIYALKIEALSALGQILEFFLDADSDVERHAFLNHLSRTIYMFDRQGNMGLDTRFSEWTENEQELSSMIEVDPIIIRFQILGELIELTKTMTGEGNPRLVQWLELSKSILSSYLSDEEMEACTEEILEMEKLEILLPMADNDFNNRALYDVALLLEGLEDYINANEIITLILTLHRGKSLFYTDTGKTGIGFTVEFGDVISIWRGNHIPMVLRGSKSPEGQAGWTLVGPAYCDGVMFGEIQPKEDDIEEFIIM